MTAVGAPFSAPKVLIQAPFHSVGKTCPFRSFRVAGTCQAARHTAACSRTQICSPACSWPGSCRVVREWEDLDSHYKPEVLDKAPGKSSEGPGIGRVNHCRQTSLDFAD